jgi:indolepyruvate ferredoxin oxidoreductase beta subunit
MSLPERTVTILIAALGGEGGGVMADWLIEAATQCGYPAQGTSIPGVAQRTGATTYYLEIYPARRELLAGRDPVMSLSPSPGGIDIMVASELIEAGRAMQSGYVNPDRTTLVASTHRIYATAEKIQMGDGRFDSARVLDAAHQLASKAVLFDMRQLAQDSGTVINSVLFGAMAGSGALPLPREACEQAIRSAGRGAEASLRGFAAGYEIASGARPIRSGSAPSAKADTATKTASGPAFPRVAAEFPAETHDVLSLGTARILEYQGERYASLYLDRLESVLEVDHSSDRALVREVARQLALWMSYEDIIRVADLKTRSSRFERVRREAGAKESEPVVVVDFLKPGLDEFASLLPRALGARLVAWGERKGKLDAYNVGLHLKTSSVLGYLVVRALAWLKPWRPRSHRYAEEQRQIERWLAAIRAAAPRSLPLAREIAECAGLVKGYGETHRRGMSNFLAIMEALVDRPPTRDPDEQARAIRKARDAALADPQGKAIGKALGRPVTWLKPTRG